MATAHRTFKLDLWVFQGSMSPQNLEVLRNLKAADDRQFTKGLRITGKVAEIRDGQSDDYAITTLDTGRWNPEAGETPRLVAKLFRSGSKRIDWAGSIEALNVAGRASTAGAGTPLINLAVILDQSTEVGRIDEVARRCFAISPRFAGAFRPDEKRWLPLRLTRQLLRPGIDYKVTDGNGRRVAFIDGRLVALGYDARVTIEDEALARNARFCHWLLLFGMTLPHLGAIRRQLRRANRAGEPVEPDATESWLLANPRRYRH
jgi:hypothetical protein